MKKRLKMKLAVKAATISSSIMFGDIHGPLSKVDRKIRKAIDRQIEKGQRKEIIVGDMPFNQNLK